jgi:hypothetical protein
LGGVLVTQPVSDFVFSTDLLPATSLLPIRRFGAMFALVMVLGDMAGEAPRRRAQGDGTVGKTGNVFEQVGMLDGRGRGLAPGKRRVAAHQDTRDSDGVEAPLVKETGNDRAGIEDIGLRDFFSAQLLGDGNFAVEIVGMRSAEARNWPAGLRPGGGKFGVRMDDPADLGKFAVEQ